MNYDTNDMWDWQGQDYSLEDDTGIEISTSLLNEVNESVEHFSYMLEDGTTPVKSCGDLAYNVSDGELMGKEADQCSEPSSQVKRRRMLQFDFEVLDASLCSDEAFLRSKETQDSLEDAMSEMPQWLAGFTEGTSDTSNEYLDPSSEGWIADCFNDAESEIQFNTNDLCRTGASDVQIGITDLCSTHPKHDANAVKKLPVHSRRNVVFRGRKSYMRTPPKLASSVVYPFAFIKPCAANGAVTLKDINQRIHTPPKPKQIEEDASCFPTSAFSGKPVVGKTKIHTEGGKGSITIMRTKG